MIGGDIENVFLLQIQFGKTMRRLFMNTFVRLCLFGATIILFFCHAISNE